MRQVPEHILQKLLRLRDLPNDSWQGADVRGARDLMGMSQVQLAEAIGYSRGGIAKIEGGTTVELVVVLALRWLLNEWPNRSEGPDAMPDAPQKNPAPPPEAAALEQWERPQLSRLPHLDRPPAGAHPPKIETP